LERFLGYLDFGVVRLNPDGSLDTSFADGGLQSIAFDLGGTNSDLAHAVAIQTDGKIVVAGSVKSSSSDDDFGVARLNPDGSLDSSFSSNGKRTIFFDLGGDNNDSAVAMAIQTDGKIVVAGSVQRNSSGDFDFGVARLTGTLPNSPPVVSLPASVSVPEGRSDLASGSWNDPDVDSWTATVDYGDGSGPQTLTLTNARTFVLNHVYPKAGHYLANVTITDSHGASGTAQVSVTVTNVAPTAWIGETPLVIPKKGSVTFQGFGGDPGHGDVLHYNWTIARKVKSPRRRPKPPKVVARGSGSSIHFSTRTKGTYLVTLVVTDSSGAQGVATRTIRR
jgi:uncharacterized delta-60 repeat protein